MRNFLPEARHEIVGFFAPPEVHIAVLPFGGMLAQMRKIEPLKDSFPKTPLQVIGQQGE
jgi:hypothetical protein